MHIYDAPITLGIPPPLPDEAALDGVEEFLIHLLRIDGPLAARAGCRRLPRR